MGAPRPIYIYLIILALHSSFDIIESIQCYSCKASGNNELEANIHCLENAYLEECEEFYQYYEEVEKGDIPEYNNNYYYYGDPAGAYPAQAGQGAYADQGAYIDPGNPKEYTDRAAYAKKENGRTRAQPVPEKEGGRSRENSPSGSETKAPSTSGSKPRSRRASNADEDGEYDTYYEYFAPNETSSSDDASRPMKETGKSEHYCYSMTSKGSWESYTVEKGCKKISYCKAAVANKPDWMNAWNFCCDRSRCNVKLVKDKPQRVYGMGCRRTDDCIQGHNSRPICPNFFKSCPKSYHGLVKMECRSPGQTMASVKTGAKYRHLYRDKKCYCSEGYFPKGPICTSSGAFLYVSLGYLILGLFITMATTRRGN